MTTATSATWLLREGCWLCVLMKSISTLLSYASQSHGKMVSRATPLGCGVSVCSVLMRQAEHMCRGQVRCPSWAVTCCQPQAERLGRIQWSRRIWVFSSATMKSSLVQVCSTQASLTGMCQRNRELSLLLPCCSLGMAQHKGQGQALRAECEWGCGVPCCEISSLFLLQWSYGFYLIHLQGKQGFQFFCKTEEMKRKWMEQFEMAM